MTGPRVLLVDNQDSYTWTLRHLLAEAAGSLPDVVDHRYASEALPGVAAGDVDLVVISAGPGHPGRDRDFAGSRAVLRQARAHGVPVLGVCLGHQGLAALAGADVVPAPEPRHGHLTRVRHGGTGLFAGVPDGFAAVRYHSLCVPEPLPGALEPLAWAEDGVVMALRARDHPGWGVQFHPESVATEHGARLVANALREAGLAPARRAGPRTRPQAVAPSPAPGASADGERRLSVRRLGRAVDAEAAFARLFGASPVAFWLDSARTDPGRGRSSVLGDASGQLAEVVLFDAATGTTRVRRGDGGTAEHTVPVLEVLRERLRARQVDGPDLPPDLPVDVAGGCVGWHGYEAGSSTVRLTRHRSAAPDAAWVFPQRLVVVDHEDDDTLLLHLDAADAEGERRSAAALDAMEAALRDLRLLDPLDPLEPPAPARVEPVWTRGRAGYTADVAAVQELLRQGEVYEACLTTGVHVPARAGGGFERYRRLRRANPAPYAAYLRLREGAADVEVLCSSPERFLCVGRDGWAESEQIKGTAARAADPAEDAALARALAADPKARAENLMVVDLVRNDLARVCAPGTVVVPALMAVRSYATVHQLVTTVRGRLASGEDALTCLDSCFPPGSMTGAPKVRAVEVLEELEPEARGVYSGALGWLGAGGTTADLAVVIRTAVRSGGAWRVGTGGAVVLGSDPGAEHDEAVLKAAPLLAVLTEPGAGAAGAGAASGSAAVSPPGAARGR